MAVLVVAGRVLARRAPGPLAVTAPRVRPSRHFRPRAPGFDVEFEYPVKKASYTEFLTGYGW